MSEEGKFTGGLRELLQNRIEQRERRLHRFWFSFAPHLESERKRALEEFANATGTDFAGQQSSAPKSRKYAAAPDVEALGDRLDELTEQVRASGATAVFQNLTDLQMETMATVSEGANDSEKGFSKLKWVLMEAFQRWETADGEPIPEDVLGKEDLDALLQPWVVERGEIVVNAMKIVTSSSEAPDLPTLPQP